MVDWKKVLVLIGLLSVLLIGSAYAQSETEVSEIWINGANVEFSLAVTVSEEGEIFAPMAEFFRKMGIQYNVSNDGEVIAFRDNIFLKLRPHHTTFALNGKEFTWDRRPAPRDDILYISLTPLLRYTDITALYEEEMERLYLTSGSLLEQRRSRGLLKRVEMPGSQISLSIPYFWERTGNASFALNPRVGKLRFEVEHEPYDLSGNLRARIDEERAESPIPPSYRLIQSRELLIGNLNVFTRRYLGSPLGSESVQPEGLPTYPYLSVTYFRLGEIFYHFTFQGELQDIDSQVETELQIFSTVQSKIFSVDALSEHYVEFGLYKELDLFIETPLYSNLLVRGEFPLKGTIDPDVTQLDVTLMRGERSFHYTVAVEDGRFDEMIPVPFGLGFHRMILAAPSEEAPMDADGALELGESGSLLIKCSLINLTEQESLYLSPSKEVLSRDPRVVEYARSASSAGIDYRKARRLLENFQEEFSAGDATTMREALEEKAGDAYALSLIYTGILRAAQIPARISQSLVTSHYYVEFYSNGQWIPTSPAALIVGEKEDLSLYFDLLPLDEKKITPLDL